MSPYSFNTGLSTSQPSPYFTNLYNQQYQTALNQQNSNYQNILGQYAQNQAAVQGQVGNVAQGYGQLSRQVLSSIQNIGASQSQAIQDVYAQQQGALNQQLVSRGLGNTTVVGSMQRGLTLDSQKAQIALANQIAQLYAGYQSQLGGAGLQAQLQGAGLQAQSGNVLTGALAGYRFPFPNYPPNVGTSTQQGYSSGGSRGGGLGGAFSSPGLGYTDPGYGNVQFSWGAGGPPADLPPEIVYGGDVGGGYSNDPFSSSGSYLAGGISEAPINQGYADPYSGYGGTDFSGFDTGFA